MRPAVIVLIVAAVVIAGVAFFGLRSYMAGLKEEAVVAPAPVVTEKSVLVAARDIPAGEILKPEDLAWQAWPESGIQPDFYVQERGAEDYGDYPGSAVRRGLLQGEPVTSAKVFKQGDAGFLAGALAPGMRAVSVSVTEVSGAAGFVLPGDRVDIILTQKVQEFDAQTQNIIDRHIAQTVLEDIRVLAVDQRTSDIEGNAVTAKTATLEVTPAQSETLALAADMGQITLALRSLTQGQAGERLGPFTADFNVSRYLGRKVQTTNRVLTVARDLQVGTLLRDQDLEWTVIAAQDLESGYYIEGAIDMQNLRGAYVKTELKKGDLLLPTKLIFPTQDSFMVAAVSPGKRAYSISISPKSIISGRISAGDYVDVILTSDVKDETPGAVLKDRRFSETVLEEVRVLAIDRVYDPEQAIWLLGATATLEVTLKQAEILANAQHMGELSLALRGSGAGFREGIPYTTDVEISKATTAFVWGLTEPPRPGTVPVAAAEEEEPAPEIAPIPAPTFAPGRAVGGGTVKVYRAGSSTTYEFTE